MRTEITYVTIHTLGRRRRYIIDLDGVHQAKGLKVIFRCVGFERPDDMVGLVRLLRDKVRGPGRRRKYVALEMTLHPSDQQERKNSFRSRSEMKRVAREVLREFHARYALVGFHGLRDIHILILNWGPTGLALKSYLPNRSNPRRVLVAVADRIERDLNTARVAARKPHLRSVEDVRTVERKHKKRRPLRDLIAEHLAVGPVPTVEDILAAISVCGFRVRLRNERIEIRYSRSQDWRTKEMDLFLRGCLRGWCDRRRSTLGEKAAPISDNELRALARRCLEAWRDHQPNRQPKSAKLSAERLIRAINRVVHDDEVGEETLEWFEVTVDEVSGRPMSITAKSTVRSYLDVSRSKAAMRLRSTIEAANRNLREFADQRRQEERKARVPLTNVEKTEVVPPTDGKTSSASDERGAVIDRAKPELPHGRDAGKSSKPSIEQIIGEIPLVVQGHEATPEFEALIDVTWDESNGKPLHFAAKAELLAGLDLGDRCAAVELRETLNAANAILRENICLEKKDRDIS